MRREDAHTIHLDMRVHEVQALRLEVVRLRRLLSAAGIDPNGRRAGAKREKAA